MNVDINKIPGMKEDELRTLTTCVVCHKKIGQTETPIFWVIEPISYMLDMRALQRQQGLAMHTGSAAMAGVMGPNEDMAKMLARGKKVMICQMCAFDLEFISVVDDEDDDDGEV